MAFAATSVSADPITQGNVLLGFGDLLSYSSYDGDLYKGDTESEFTINGDTMLFAQYFVINGLAIGGTVQYLTTSYDAAPGDTEEETFWMAGPLVSFYIPINQQLLFSISGYYLMANAEAKFNGGGDLSVDMTSYGVIAEINYMLTSFLAISAGIDYSFDNVEINDYDYDEDGNTLSFNVGFKVFI